MSPEPVAEVALPAWSEPMGPDDHQGMWPLGLEPVGFSFVNQLLPGITNTTTRVRYYSFFSWVFWTYREFVEQSGREPTREEQDRWRARMENIFRAATLHADPDVTGLVGQSKVSNLPEPPHASYPVTGDDAPTAFKAAQYSSSFRALGCADERDEVVELTRQTGARLAEAFDATLRRDGLSDEDRERLVSLSATLPAGLIRRLSDAFSLAPVPPATREHNELTNLLFRTRRPRQRKEWRAQDRSRATSLALLLEVIRQAGGSVTSRSDLHPLFASEEFPDDQKFVVPPPCEDNWKRWRRYQERQFQKRGLYALFCDVWDAIRGGADESPAVLALLTTRARNSEWLADWVGDGGLSLSVEQAQHRTLKRYRTLRSEGGWSAEDLSRAVARAGFGDRTAGALVLLLLVVGLWRERRTDLPEWAVSMHREYGLRRLALDVMTDEIRDRSHQPLDELLRWLIETCILSQSFRIAGEKLARDGQFRFFIVHGHEGYETVTSTDPTNYMNYDAPRMRGASRLMRDLGLLRTGGESWTLTGVGEDLLDETLSNLQERPSDEASGSD